MGPHTTIIISEGEETMMKQTQTYTPAMQMAAAYDAGYKYGSNVKSKPEGPFGMTRKEFADGCTSLMMCAAMFCMGIFVMIPLKADRMSFILCMALVILFMLAGSICATVSLIEKAKEELRKE
jgi:hypothetical protein